MSSSSLNHSSSARAVHTCLAQMPDIYITSRPISISSGDDLKVPVSTDLKSQLGSSTQATCLESKCNACFNCLPVEIRLEIWKEITPPRIVEVRFSAFSRSAQHDIVADFPIALHINQESRAYALKSGYEIAIQTPNNASKYPTYFNYATETLLLREPTNLYFSTNNIRGFLTTLPDIHRFKRVVMGIPSATPNSRTPLAPLIYMFSGLEELTVFSRHMSTHQRPQCPRVFPGPKNRMVLTEVPSGDRQHGSLQLFRWLLEGEAQRRGHVGWAPKVKLCEVRSDNIRAEDFYLTPLQRTIGTRSRRLRVWVI